MWSVVRSLLPHCRAAQSTVCVRCTAIGHTVSWHTPMFAQRSSLVMGRVSRCNLLSTAGAHMCTLHIYPEPWPLGHRQLHHVHVAVSCGSTMTGGFHHAPSQQQKKKSDRTSRQTQAGIGHSATCEVIIATELTEMQQAQGQLPHTHEGICL